LEELRRRIEELENRQIGDVGAIADSESKDEMEEERNVDERDSVKRLISFLKDRGNARVEVSFYDGSLKAKTLVDWIGKQERYIEYENGQDPNRVHFAITKLKGHVAL
jgi:hypothetical protein